MKIPEEIRQKINQHIVNIGDGNGDAIPGFEVDDIIAEVLEILKARGHHYPQSRSPGGGWWVFILENEPNRSG